MMVNVQSILSQEIQSYNINMLRVPGEIHSNLKMALRCINSATNYNAPKTQLKHIRNLTSSITSNPDNLPHLPVPKLEDTLKKYLRSVQPLLSKESYSRTEQLIKKFIETNGPKLHTLLQNRAGKTDNWLADWWLKYAYLTYRAPVVINSNPGLYFSTEFFENDYEWIKYTAKIIAASLKFKEMIDLNQVQPERAGKFLLDMGQYKKIFGTCRIPAHNMDKIEYNMNSRHIVVAYKNGFFKVPVYLENTNKLIGEQTIIEQLLQIVKLDSSDNIPIGILTTEHRDILAGAYERLIEDSQNISSIDCISKSLFLVCLDDPVNQSISNPCNTASHQLIHGGGSKQNTGNRWFDKTLQFIINKNGISGLNYEHSPAEGQPIAVLTDFIIKSLKSSDTDPKTFNNGVIAQPQKLIFNISKKTENDIQNASVNIDKFMNNLDMNVVFFSGYGKNFIKSQKMSPDSYCQMAMQYAYYKYHSEPGAHYETAQQRMFIHGRTETIRSCSNESVAFAKGMCDDKISDAEKVKLLAAAVTGHKNYTTMAMSGYGIDRHLLGLKVLAIENDIAMPDIYADEGYVKSTHFKISTSQVASNDKIFMCYGPAVEDGYGICYNPRNNDMIFAVSAYKSCPHTSAEKMGKCLTEALNNMYLLLSKAGEKPKSKM